MLPAGNSGPGGAQRPPAGPHGPGRAADGDLPPDVPGDGDGPQPRDRTLQHAAQREPGRGGEGEALLIPVHAASAFILISIQHFCTHEAALLERSRRPKRWERSRDARATLINMSFNYPLFVCLRAAAIASVTLLISFFISSSGFLIAWNILALASAAAFIKCRNNCETLSELIQIWWKTAKETSEGA